MQKLQEMIGQQIGPESIQHVLQFIKEEKYTKGSFVLQAEQTARKLYWVESGILRGFYYKDNKDVTNWFAVEGDFATSMYSFIAQKPSYEYIEALGDARLFGISYTHLQALYLQIPALERVGRLTVERYYTLLEERVMSLQFKTAKERYESLLLQEPHLLQSVNLGHIASYLGITQETLSRIRSS